MIDIIIPTLNVGETLGECLESLAKQTRKVNPIIVDGGSTDKTLEIAQKHNATTLHEDRERFVGNSGRANACNVGLNCSRSEHVAFLDADVVVPQQWARDLSSWLKDDIGAVTSGCIPEGKIGKVLASRLGSAGSHHARRFKETRFIESVPGYNAMYQRKAIDQVGLFNEEIGGCEDWEMNHRLREAGWKILGVTRSPVQHRERRNLWGFAKQMYGYGWSRARLARVTRIFTPIHAVPLLSLFLLLMVRLLAPPWAALLVFGYLGLLVFYSVKLRTYMAFYVFLFQHFSWAAGYLAGLLKR